MLVNKYWLIVFLLLTFFLISISAIVAAQLDIIVPETSFPVDNPTEVQLNYLITFIRDYNPYLNSQQIQDLCNSILTEASLTGFEPLFISSIIAAESSFYPNAVSPCAALGLMQLTSCVIQSMNIHDPFNIQENIYGGTRFLKYLKGIFSDYDLILAAYNAGPTRVAKLGRIPNIIETINYVKKVKSLFNLQQQALYSAIQKALSEPLLYPVVMSFDHKTISIQSKLIKKSTTHNPNEPSELCEADRSIRFIFYT